MPPTMTKIRIWALLFIIFAAFAGWFIWASETNLELDRFAFKLGLDLDGGAHLTYRADVSEIDPADIDDSMNALRQTIERRINIFNVSEPIVQVETGGVFSSDLDAYRLIVELPGETDISEAIKQIGATPVLEFKLPKEDTEDFDSTTAIEEATTTEEALSIIRNQFISTGLSGSQLERASLTFDNVTNAPTIVLNYNKDGKELLSQITSENVGKTMAIFLDGILISDPVIREEIPNGQAVISGGFTPEEARDLVRNLNFGALPVPIELIQTQTIGATLGGETVENGITALLIGFAIIFIFLVSLYRLPGIIATAALVFYVFLMLLLFKLIPVTLTASGLAGFILSIGMAVDANILIFERMKEEQEDGASFYESVQSGTKRAWTSIRDGNLTSIISAIVLYWLSGTSLVKGFALVFGMGVLVSMFTAVTFSKILLLAISAQNKLSVKISKSKK